MKEKIKLDKYAVYEKGRMYAGRLHHWQGMRVNAMEEIKYTTLDAVLTGRKIKRILTQKGCSVRKIQAMLNLSCPKPVYRWMNGQALPSIDNLYMMHRIFGVHMEEMLGAKDEADREGIDLKE